MTFSAGRDSCVYVCVLWLLDATTHDITQHVRLTCKSLRYLKVSCVFATMSWTVCCPVQHSVAVFTLRSSNHMAIWFVRCAASH